MRTKQIAILSFSLWLVIISLFMLFSGLFDVTLFFVLGFIGFLVIVVLTDPHYIKPGYLGYVKFLIVAGILLSGAIIVLKVMEIMGLEFIIG
jgi:hypothetical protein